MDVLEVGFQPKGAFTAARMIIAPFGRAAAPSLTGTLASTKRSDGVGMMRLDDLGSLFGLDGPLATVECATLIVEDARRKGSLRVGYAELAGMLGDGIILPGLVAEGGRQEILDANTCANAKAAFIQHTT